MKLEVGQFARLKGGYICKIINVNDFREPNMKYGVEANYLKDVMFIGDDDVVKASYNIIDILEVGDYVNGYKVSFKGDDYQPFVQCDYPVEEGSTNHYRFYEKAIYSIVTKEQFESMSYKVC